MMGTLLLVLTALFWVPVLFMAVLSVVAVLGTCLFAAIALPFIVLFGD